MKKSRLQNFRLTDPQYLLAKALQEQSIDSSPAKGGWVEGFSRMGKAWIAKQEREKAEKRFKTGEMERSNTFSQALKASQGFTDPDTGQQLTPGSMENAFGVLMRASDPDLQDKGFGLLMKHKASEQARRNAILAERRKLRNSKELESHKQRARVNAENDKLVKEQKLFEEHQLGGGGMSWDDWLADYRKKGAPQTNINMGTQEKEEGKAYGRLLVEREGKVYEAGDMAQKTIANLGMARQIAANPQALPADMANVAGTVAQSFGIPLPKGFESSVTSGQAFEGLMGNILAEKLAAQKGPQTDKDADRMEKTLATLKNTPKAKIFLLDSARALHSRDIEKAQFFREWRANKGTITGAELSWQKTMGKVPLFGVNPNSNLPVFYDEFRARMKQANPGATSKEIREFWVKKYGK